jgi:predicted lipid-binding transport protein (Tim44 family)
MSPHRRRILLAAMLAVAALVLMLAPDALAAAGGGSAGFSGGGGGGGFGGGEGGGGGGGGAGLFILFQLLFRIAFLGNGLGALVLIGLFVIWLVMTRGTGPARAFRAARSNQGRAQRSRTAQRQRRVELAAAEAAEEDPAFAPDVVKPAAARLFLDVQAAWDANDRATLTRLVAPDLLTEWERRLDDFDRRGWRNRVKPLGDPNVDYVGLIHRGSASDRVVVRIQATVRDYVEDRAGNHVNRAGAFRETVQLREFWTLRKRGSGWMLVSIEQGAEGAHALDEQVVASAYADEQAMRDESLVEGAVAEAVPEGTSVAEVADLQFDGDAHAAAMDLSVADGRFAPDVLEVAARRAVDAWAEAVDGADGPLLAIAHPDAVRDLLHPGGASTRLVVRGPRVKQIRVVALDAGATPPRMSIEVDLAGRRYVEDRATTSVVAGSRSREVSFTEHWTFALDGPPAQPWRLTAAGAPLAQA